ncbi:NAD-dependent epimerase/dehydratase family protein [Micromonospora chokoriensis]|uniref:UDP-glucose 4-epimerase n=1 Tax=Micromonospora chokoriensis TaxID=356851 RepID=A0A1C4XTQ2_9ACTN|nr:NAD-dependent epimerase/dehydratase family protein [Micromonospora chokoriensis]SCF11686.1 UDP-glucose 4-epimerase [Micromonospora chokoriensis]
MDQPVTAVGVAPSADLTPRRVLVTGGAGFIGGHVVARLMLMGSQVRVLDNFSTGRLENLADAAYGGLTEADVISGDIRTPEGVEVIHQWQPDVVVHLAAQPSLPAARRSPLYDADVNVFGTVNVLDACVRSGVRLVINAASSAIFGSVPAHDLPVREDHPIAPASPYGVSKAAGVHYLEWYGRQHGLSYTSMVFGNVYGPRQEGGDCGVVSLMADALLGGRQVVIYDDGTQTRDFIHVSDVAEAVAVACHHPGAGLVNIASGRQTSINEVFDTVREASGVGNAARYEPLPWPGEVRNMALDTRKARELLGWHPKLGFTEGVRMTVRDARRRQAGGQLLSPVRALDRATEALAVNA